MGPIYSLSDFLDMVRRRIGLISFVFITGCIGSVIWALSQQHMYSASEVIQIEQPKIAGDLAPSTVDGSAARRFQLIEQQVMARGSLQDIIDKFGLYDDLTALTPIEKINLLRQSVSINGVAAVREGYSDDGAISILTITASMDEAELARDVAHEFGERTRTLASRQRASQTQETLEFFQTREEALLADIAALDEELTRFRSENDLSIVGSLEFRRDELGNLNQSILEIDREIIAAQLAKGRVDRSRREATVAREMAEYDGILASLTDQRKLLQDRREVLNASLETTPEVERELASFERRMDRLQEQLNVISTRRAEAEVGYSLEAAERGERLITLEEARVPEYPYTMSRKKRAVIGAAGATLLALALAFLLELRHPVIRTAKQMQRETGLMPVVSIPPMAMRKELKGFRKVQAKRRAAGLEGRNARLARKT